MSDEKTTPTTVSVKAPWVLSEILPLLVFAGIAVTNVVLGITGATTWTAAGVAIGLAILVMGIIFLVSSKRKKNSTVHGQFSPDDEERWLNVWMTKPMQDKWNGRLDEGRNKSPLALAVRVEYKLYGNTPVFLFTSSTNRTVAVPQRLLEQPDVYKFVKETVESLPPLRFRNTDSAEQFAGYIGTGRLNPVDVAPVAIVHPNAQAEAAIHGRSVKTPKKADAKKDEVPADDRLRVVVEENEVAAPAKDEGPVKPVVTVDYSEFRVTPATTFADSDGGPALLVSGLHSSLDEPEPEVVDEGRDDGVESGWSAGSLLLGGGVSSETVDSDTSRNQK